jgi:hypothetical protein
MASETLGDALTEPRADECPCCYVERMLEVFGCDRNLRWIGRWRDQARPRATWLERRLEFAGIVCDCQVPRREAAVFHALVSEAPRRRRR